MPVPRLIGRLGGPPEVVETQIAAISSGSHSVTLPTGWGSGWCVFQGTVDGSARPNVTIFGRTTHGDGYLYGNTPVGGGAPPGGSVHDDRLTTGGHAHSDSHVVTPGRWSDGHRTTDRQTRRGIVGGCGPDGELVIPRGAGDRGRKNRHRPRAIDPHILDISKKRHRGEASRSIWDRRPLSDRPLGRRDQSRRRRDSRAAHRGRHALTLGGGR